MRGRSEGMWNVVRFNWPKYALGSFVALVVVVCAVLTTGTWSVALVVIAVFAVTALSLPLLASYVIYDRSDLYALRWLDDLDPAWMGVVLNINAGFDETSNMIQRRLKNCEFHALDFYDRTKHTEPSIERARKAYQTFPGTRPISTGQLPFADTSVDLALAFLSLHEIRNGEERVRFLTDIRRTLKPDGQLIITEHLRDPANFMAFNFGFLHFHSRRTWLHAFEHADLQLIGERRTTPFITTFILRSA